MQSSNGSNNIQPFSDFSSILYMEVWNIHQSIHWYLDITNIKGNKTMLAWFVVVRLNQTKLVFLRNRLVDII